jgi:hypothetical protein
MRIDAAKSRLDELLTEARSSAHALADELEQVGDEHDLISHLFVGVAQLHASLKLRDIVAAVAETLINLVGTEDFALFVRDETSGRFEKLWSTGPKASQLGGFAGGQGAFGRAVAGDGIVYDEGSVATIPLAGSLQPGCFAAVVVCSLVGHKPALTARDHQFLATFAEHGARALEAAIRLAQAPSMPTSVGELKRALEEAV